MTEEERDKNAARRLAILRHAEEVTGNVALTCRYYGMINASTLRGEAQPVSTVTLTLPGWSPADLVERVMICGFAGSGAGCSAVW